MTTVQIFCTTEDCQYNEQKRCTAETIHLESCTPDAGNVFACSEFCEKGTTAGSLLKQSDSPMTKDKKPEPATCLHCGAEVTESDAMGEWWFQCKCQYTAKTEAEAIAAWNRRHVCDDMHGKPVYAGDKVKIIFDDPSVFDGDDDFDSTATVRLGGYADFNEPDFCDTLLSDRDFAAQIELIESEPNHE